MNKKIIILGITTLLVLSISGCFEQKKDNNDSKITYDGEVYTWSIERFMEEQNIQGNITAWLYYKTGITISYDTLEDGDTLIIKDKIPEDIMYYPEKDITEIPFSLVISDDNNGTTTRIHSVLIKGDITNEFLPGTNFTMTVHIKHINVTAENFMNSGESIKLDMELFHEQCDKDEDFFKTSLTDPNVPFDEAIKPMSKTVIEKT